MNILYFEEAEIGKSRTAGPYLVSKNEIIEFAKKYDPQPFHTDEETAARSVFKGLTTLVAHTFAILISKDSFDSIGQERQSPCSVEFIIQR